MAGADTHIILAIVSILIALLGLLFVVFPRSLKSAVSWLRQCLRWRKLKIYSEWKLDLIRKRIQTAEREVWILQTWIPNLRSDYQAWEKASPKVVFRFLLCHSSLVPLRLACRRRHSALLELNEADLGEFGKEFKGISLSSQYKTIPFGPIVRVDDRVYFGLYLAHVDSMAGPMFCCDVGSEIGQLVVRSMEAVWRSCRRNMKLLGGDKIPPTDKPEPSPRPIDVITGVDLASDIREVQIDKVIAHGGPTLVLFRHAMTELNDKGIYSGQQDVPMNSTGVVQAQHLCKKLQHLHFDKAYASPFLRTVETLKIAYPFLKGSIERRAELGERSMGRWEGLPQSCVNPPERVSLTWRPQGGECLLEVAERTKQVLQDILGEVLKGTSILVCGHESTVRLARMMLDYRDDITDFNGWVTERLAEPMEHCVPYIYQVGGKTDRQYST